jgi:formylglycine-generating enzyme required for sulfatase activity
MRCSQTISSRCLALACFVGACLLAGCNESGISEISTTSNDTSSGTTNSDTSDTTNSDTSDTTNSDTSDTNNSDTSDTTNVTDPEEAGARQMFGSSAYRFIPSGTFTMGSPPDELGRDKSEAEHQVTLTKGFWMKETEVTQAEWEAVMENNPSNALPVMSCGSNCPVNSVNWWDAVQFCNTLSAQQGLTACYMLSGCNNTPGSTCDSISENLGCTGYRLPTEAEWERAYRADTSTAFYNGAITDTGCNDPNMNAIGWYCGNANNNAHPVAGKAANGWGLYDMSGNVWEWVWDWYYTYPDTHQSDPKGSSTGLFRIVRGGSWNHDALFCRAALRAGDSPILRRSDVGLRLVRSY